VMQSATLEPPKTANAKYFARALRILHPPGSTFEIRALCVDGRKQKTASGLFRDFDKAGQAILALEKRGAAGIYCVKNLVNPDLYARSPERVKDFPDQTTGDKDIIRRNWILIDVDPERPAGVSSTDEELEAATILAADVRDWLVERMGFLEPVEAMSGNGVHLLFPVDLPNDDESTALVKSVLEAAKVKAEELQSPSRPTCKVDTSVFNAARITKVYGTLAAKGGDIPDRPHRRSHLTHIPSGLNWEGQ
jgi:hypothetical protein